MNEKVKIYTTPTCPYCKMTKEFLTEKGVDFIAYDVTKDREALKEMQRITGGARSVPVIHACNQVMIGFDSSRVGQALTCMRQSSKIPE
jgi:glutaredoxin 3